MADTTISGATSVTAPGKGEQTRERLLEIAEARILRHGFTGTSIEDVIAEAGLTRSGFFYHFPDKHHLAMALLERYIAHDEAIFQELFARADELVEDPLHAFLAFLKMFSEVMNDLPSRHPGCLVASYCYQEQIFSREIREKSASTFLIWRARFRERLDAIAERYPPRPGVDLDALAGLVLTIVEGGIILDRTLQRGRILPQQILMVREVVRRTFSPQ